MELTELIRSAWGWTGIDPTEVVGENDFGNLIVRDARDRYWRICPEDLYCKLVANDRAELDTMSKDQEFLRDWYMSTLVDAAKKRIGPLSPGRKYCLKIPAVLGGEYSGDNVTSMALAELIAVSGDISRQIDGLPEGSHIRLCVEK